MYCPKCKANLDPSFEICPVCEYEFPQEQLAMYADSYEVSDSISTGGSVGAVGSIIMFLQNLLIIIALIVSIFALSAILSNSFAVFRQLAFAYSLISISFYMDYIGIAIISIAILIISKGLKEGAYGRRIGPTTYKFGIIVGVTCVSWVILTIVWRLIYPTIVASNMISLIEEGFMVDPSNMSTVQLLFGSMSGMMIVWIVASSVFMLATIMFSLYLNKVKREIAYDFNLRSISWPIFSVINLIGTILIAYFVLAMIGGSFMFGNLIGGLIIKVLVVPGIALYVYISLTLKFLKMKTPIAYGGPMFMQAVPMQPAPTIPVRATEMKSQPSTTISQSQVVVNQKVVKAERKRDEYKPEDSFCPVCNAAVSSKSSFCEVCNAKLFLSSNST